MHGSWRRIGCGNCARPFFFFFFLCTQIVFEKRCGPPSAEVYRDYCVNQKSKYISKCIAIKCCRLELSCNVAIYNLVAAQCGPCVRTCQPLCGIAQFTAVNF